MFNKKKGFTIVELVIVIAVIAILAAVMIPTFSGVIENANKSNALSTARIAWDNYLADVAISGNVPTNGKIVVTYNKKDYSFYMVDGKLKDAAPAGVEYDEGEDKDLYKNSENKTLDAADTVAIYAVKPADSNQ